VRARVASLALTLLVTIAGCGDSSPETTREADVYAAAIRALVRPETDADRVTRDVFVGAEAGTIPIALQSDVLQELSEYDNLRFVDARQEALDDDPPMAVKNHGVYLEVRDLQLASRFARMQVLRYLDAEDQHEYTVDLRRAGGRWSVVETHRS
jgi:hypothetical protein